LAESKEPIPQSGRARRSQNQFTPLGEGVNKLIFKLYGTFIFLIAATH
jgi:hypothetical protein